MQIEESSLAREMDKIMNGGPNPVHYEWVAIVKANKISYTATKVVSIDFLANFEGNYADEILVHLTFPGGTFFKRIFPYKQNLEITLIRKPIYESGNSSVVKQVPFDSEVYTATLLDMPNPVADGNTKFVPTEENLNRTLLAEPHFQLVNKAIEQLRFISVGGIYRNVKVEDLVKGILTTNSKLPNVPNARLPKGVSMVTATNTKPRDHVVIPQGTQLLSVPDFVNKKCGGIYNAGLGFYLQGDFWYLYPCFDTNRFKTADKTLTVINVPPHRYKGIERTYRDSGRSLVVLATGEFKFSDSSESQQLNEGNGVRFADANKFMGGFTETSNNKTVASRGKNNNEFMGESRKNGNNNIRQSGNAISDNPLVELSKLAKRQGSIVLLAWENSNHSLIKPGMVAKIMYLEDDKIKELSGVVLQAHTYVSMKTQGTFGNRYTSTTGISMFVKRVVAT